MSSEQGEPHTDRTTRTTQETTENDPGSPGPANQSIDQGELIDREYKQIVRDLNNDAVSFTMPSAEGITMYRGIGGHRNNGNMRKLARAGLVALMEQIEEERAAKRKAKKREAKEARKQRALEKAVVTGREGEQQNDTERHPPQDAQEQS
jgi:hypothetical protein